MSDARTAPPPKAATNDPSTSKKEKRIPASAGLESHERASTQEDVPLAEQLDKPAFGFSEAAARADDRNDVAGAAARPQRADDPLSGSDTQLLSTAFSFAVRNVETVVNSTHVAMRGAEEIAQTAVEFGQRNIQQLSTMVRKLSETKTISELVTLQREQSLAAVEELLEEAMRVNERLTRTVGEIVDTVLKQQVDLAGAEQRKAA